MNWKHNVPPSRQRSVSRGKCAVGHRESNLWLLISIRARVLTLHHHLHLCHPTGETLGVPVIVYWIKLGLLLVHLSRTCHVLFTAFYSSPGSECAQQKHSKASLMNLWRVGSNKTHSFGEHPPLMRVHSTKPFALKDAAKNACIGEESGIVRHNKGFCLPVLRVPLPRPAKVAESVCSGTMESRTTISSSSPMRDLWAIM